MTSNDLTTIFIYDVHSNEHILYVIEPYAETASFYQTMSGISPVHIVTERILFPGGQPPDPRGSLRESL
jgi:hypothetical protein